MAKTLRELFINEEPDKVIHSGTQGFDEAFNGFNPGKIIVLTGRHGIGKTSALLRLAKNFHREHGSSIHWMSRNETQYEIGKRYYHLHESERQFEETKPTNNLEFYEHFKLHDFINISEVPKWLESLISTSNQSLIVVENDKAFAPPYTEDKALEVQRVFEKCKRLLHGTNHILVFSNNCSIDTENCGGPMMPTLKFVPYFDYYSHLVDKVISAYRYEYYGFEQDHEGNDVYDIILLSALYNRSGATAEFKMHHRGVNIRIHETPHYIENEVFDLSYGEFEFEAKEHVRFTEVVIRIKDGIPIRSANFLDLELAWEFVLKFLELSEDDPKWLNIELHKVSSDATKFFSGRLQLLLDKHEKFDSELKEKYSKWLKMLSNKWYIRNWSNENDHEDSTDFEDSTDDDDSLDTPF